MATQLKDAVTDTLKEAAQALGEQHKIGLTELGENHKTGLLGLGLSLGLSLGLCAVVCFVLYNHSTTAASTTTGTHQKRDWVSCCASLSHGGLAILKLFSYVQNCIVL